jgi:HK97 family phage portal protein
MCIPSGLVQYKEGTLRPQEIKDAEAAWKKAVGGLKRAGSVKVTDQNWDFKPLSINPKDMQYQEGRKWLRETIANACGVPMSLITPDESNKASSLVAIANYMKFTILPLCEMITDKINKMLIKHFDENLFCAFENPVKEDNEFILHRDEMQIKMGMVTVNEWRAKEGLQAVPWGDDKYRIERETATEKEQVGEVPEDKPAPAGEAENEAEDQAAEEH